MERAVVCDDLTVTYGDLIAVDRVSFEVGHGEVFGLLGPNGAGKTSVVRVLTTILDPASGRAEVAGLPLRDSDELRSRIGVLPESNGYPSSETALEYLRFFGRLHGMDRHEAGARAAELLDRFGLSNVTARSISTFSRGMRQRLGLARALLNRPRVLFLDEPTLGLDPAGREDILSLLAGGTLTDGTSVVLCSHLLDDVERVCDRIGILDGGRLVASGTVSEVIDESHVGGHVRLMVAPSAAGSTAESLGRLPEVVRAEANQRRPGAVDVELAERDPHANRLLAKLIELGIEVRGVELQGARLSDAFFRLTGRGAQR